MNHFEIKATLESMTLLVDTREQPTKRLERRIETCGLPSERKALNVGDYSCFVTLPDGSILDFSDKVVVERKMNIDELCLNFGQERARFEREFERAKEAGIKVYLLIENDNWEKVYNGRYRSRMTPQALIASINAFRTRYNMQLDFCKEETTGKLIKDILYREVKEYLEDNYGKR
jgi:ERCC4-type nuclease